MKSPLIYLPIIFCSVFIAYFTLTFFIFKDTKVKNKKENQQEIIVKGNTSDLEDNYDNQEEGETFNEIEVEEITLTPKTNASKLDFSKTLANYNTWKVYHKENIDLSTDFTGVDTNNNEVSKNKFIEALKTGNYIPVKLFNATYMYQLYKIDQKADEKISKSIKKYANVALNYFLKEGTSFPDFNFEDINANSYTSKNTKGNILVIDCWFLKCPQCIAEIPMLNDLYDRYESHDNLIFFSLAFDTSEKTKKFLSTKEFRYPVVTNQKDFIKNELKVIEYPTHIIVDEHGAIKKMVNNADSLILTLDTMVNSNDI